MVTIKAVCTSEVKGVQKSETSSIELRPDWAYRMMLMLESGIGR